MEKKENEQSRHKLGAKERKEGDGKGYIAEKQKATKPLFPSSLRSPPPKKKKMAGKNRAK